MLSQIWMSTVISDMSDQLTFIDGRKSTYSWRAAAIGANQVHELRPSLWRTFGLPAAMVNVSVVDTLSQPNYDQDKNLVSGTLRAAAWVESNKGNASALCAHFVVINTALTATTAFTAQLSGDAFALFSVKGGSRKFRAVRLFDNGPFLNISSGGAVQVRTMLQC